MIDFTKLKIIIKREYVTRIRTKAFILTTLLLPVGMLLLIGLPIAIQMMDSDTQYEIAILDETGMVYPELAEIDSVRYRDYGSQTVEQLRTMVMEGDLNGYIRFSEDHIDEDLNPEFIYGGSGGISLISDIEDDIRSAIREVRLNRAEVSSDVRSILDLRPELATRKLTAEGEEESSNTIFLFILGYAMAFIIYGAMFGYGGLVMRSVIEEKTNRIMEVMASSVKPIELLLGKVLGVGALGFTQFMVWIAAGAGIMAVMGPLAATFMDPGEAAGAAGEGAAAMPAIPAVDPMIWVWFVVFFLLGYFIYSAIFAAMGSAVDSETDTQQLMLPIMIPIIVAIILVPKVASDPDSTLAVVSSLIPFLSPILMIARLPITDVPVWQLALCIFLMLATIAACMALAAKIYRVGILMYGKKPSFREIYRWIRA